MSATHKVLVVDDTDASRYLVARILRARGFDVIEASSGRDALALSQEEQPDVVVLDVKLPDIHGFEVVERLKADPRTRSISIVHLSASFTAPDARAEGLQRGADGYLTHPVDPEVLTATITAMLRLREAQQREREARERAEANEARYRFLAEMVPQMVWSNDPAGRIDYLNERWLRTTGLSFEEARDGRWRESIHPEDRERLTAVWTRALATGEPYEVEARQGNDRTGVFRWQLMRALPMRDAAGRVERWFGTATDIEEQKAAQRDRERLVDELERSAAEREKLIARMQEEDQRKNEFLAVLSHELRNPLAPIRNSVYILQRAVPGGEQARHARDVIDRQVEQLTHLVDDLLDVTRISRGKIRLRQEKVELASVVRGVGDDMRNVFADQGVGLEVRIGREPLYVLGDPTRIAQVVGNLLQNSSKFTPAGGSTELSLTAQDAQAVVVVRDDGPGIPEDVLPHIFEPFVQAERTLERSRGGLGLGLALVKGLVELHHGSVSAESAGAGQGAQFTIHLPLAVDAASSGEEPGGARRPPPRRRVLVIEDNEDAARSLCEVLEIDEHAVEVCRNGADGLATARRFQPDVVLCDLGLPGMSGYDVARALRADPQFEPTLLIALSGYALQDDVDRATASGFDHHLAKPPDLAALHRLLAAGR